MMEKPDVNKDVDTINVVLRIVEHGRGGRVEVTEYWPCGVTRSSLRKKEYDSYSEVKKMTETSGTRYNNGELKPIIATKQAVLNWANEFNHYDIEKLII